MKKIILSILLSTLFSNILLAREADKEFNYALKPFAGVMVGTTTQSGMVSNNNGSYGYAYLPLFQSGLWGGFDYNIDKFAIRIYGNILTTLLGSVAETTYSISTTRMIFSGNIDLIYSPTQIIGVFIGFGLGDTMLGQTMKNEKHANAITENYFTTMGNFGVQYNIDSNSFLELSTIINIMWRFSVISNNGTTIPLFSPAASVSYSMMAKYGYRF